MSPPPSGLRRVPFTVFTLVTRGRFLDVGVKIYHCIQWGNHQRASPNVKTPYGTCAVNKLGPTCAATCGASSVNPTSRDGTRGQRI